MLWPGFEPGLLRPQRNVIATTLPQLIFEGQQIPTQEEKEVRKNARLHAKESHFVIRKALCCERSAETPYLQR